MAAREYIGSGDFTATVVQDYDMATYIDRANDHLESVAYSLGVTPTGIADPIDFMFKEYAMAWAYRQAYQDKIGANNIDVGDTDKYLVLYEMQNTEVEKLRKTLTPEIVAGTADQPNEYAATSSVIYRG